MATTARQRRAPREAVATLTLMAAFLLALVPALHDHPPVLPDQSPSGQGLACTLCALFSAEPVQEPAPTTGLARPEIVPAEGAPAPLDLGHAPVPGARAPPSRGA